MKKLSYSQFSDVMHEYNAKHPEGNPTLHGVIVFTEDSFAAPYTVRERSYKTDNHQKAFNRGMISNSIFADCLDGTDPGVRLDWYMHDESFPWKVEYCYFLEETKI